MSNCNSGCITFGKELSEEALEAYKDYVSYNNRKDDFVTMIESVIGENEIEWEDFFYTGFESLLEDLVNALAPLGYEINADITYCTDDLDTGKIYADKNIVSEYANEDKWKHDAGIYELMEVIRSRGYSVTIEKLA